MRYIGEEEIYKQFLFLMLVHQTMLGKKCIAKISSDFRGVLFKI